jgi:hypothetical protein
MTVAGASDACDGNPRRRGHSEVENPADRSPVFIAATEVVERVEYRNRVEKFPGKPGTGTARAQLT